MRYSKSSLKREIYHNTSIPQKIGKTQIYMLTLHLKELEKEQQIKPTPSRRALIKIRAKLNEIETRKTVEKINKTRSWFFERITMINKPLASLIKNKREKTLINKITNKKERSPPIPRKYKQF